MKTSTKMGLLGSLYISQGLPFGFFTQALPVFLRSQGAALSVIGLTYLLALPWALKFLWAPRIERGHSPALGRRRSWILPLQLATALLMAALALSPPEAYLAVVLGGVLVANLLCATQDIATDGLAVDLLEARERGLGNGIQVAGYRVGMIIGGGVLLIVFESLGWTRTMLVLACCIAAATLPVAFYREPVTSGRAADRMPSIRAFVQRPGVAAWLLILALYKSGEAFAVSMLRPLFVDMGLSMADIGWLLGTVGFTAGLLGALAGGAAIPRLGKKCALLAYGTGQAVAVAACILLAKSHGSMALIVIVTVAEHALGGMATAALFTLMMDVCGKDSAATDYTVQASLVVVATGIAAALSGVSAAALGYAGHFALAALLCAASLVAITQPLWRRTASLWNHEPNAGGQVRTPVLEIAP